MTIEDAARKLRVTPAMVYRLLRVGKLEYEHRGQRGKTGQAATITDESVERWLEVRRAALREKLRELGNGDA